MKLNIKFTIVIIFFAVAPIAILAGFLFYNMEQNVIDENINYMQYTMERNADQIKTNMDSITMSTQFFLSDEQLTQILTHAVDGSELTTEELLQFHDSDVAALERLVNNNPLLYCVRVFSISDSVQEMMPILYRSSRMEKLSWSQEASITGWHFNYTDTIFSSLIINQEKKILSMVTPINDFDRGEIGVVEACMSMETMFPGLYETIENEWSCFAADDGTLYFGDNQRANSESLVKQIMAQKLENMEQETYYTRIDGSNIIISYLPLTEMGGALISVQDITKDVHDVYRQRNFFIVVMILILAALTFVINYIVKRMLRQFYAILKTIRQVQHGNLSVRIKQCSNDEMGEVSNQLNTMLDKVERLMQDNINREVLAKNSQIRALQNQINAHFIYNVLESIKMMAEIDEEYAISDAITSLGKLLRYGMRWVNGNVMVKDEIEYIKNYLALINLRFDYEIYLSLNLPEAILEQEIPKMSLQPIVENAILHGIEQMAEDTNIYMKGIIKEGDCFIEITDAGKGMTAEEVEALRKKIAGEIETAGGSGNGIGLKNVQDRIVIAFGSQYGLSVDSQEGCFTKVTVRIPMKKKSVGGTS